MMHPITVENLVVRYAKKKALDGVSFSVKSGEIFGFIGPNGAGKSTTIKSLLGLILPDEGVIRLDGLSPGQARSRMKVGFLPEETTFYRFLTPLEILDYYGRLFGLDGKLLKQRITYVLERVGLAEVRHRRIGTFSKGMVQKVGLAQALINDPEILILDEPTSGLDPLARLELRGVLAELKKRGRTLFFSSHELSEVELLCDSIAILREGRIVRSGSLEEVVGTDRRKNLELFFLETMQAPT